MADNAKVLVRRAKKLGVAGLGSLAVSAALLSFGAGAASAEEITSDPASPSGGPIAEDGVRPSGWQEYDATQTILIEEGEITFGEGVTDSNIAIPGTIAEPPEPGDIGFCIIDYAGC
ncbi:MAG: hypothetical protein ACSLE6_05550 [Mycobacterium sp.]